MRIGMSPELSARLEIGGSLAVAGVCLTAVALEPGEMTVDLAPETIRRTNLGGLGDGAPVNLEPPLAAGEPLGGHWVQGHVDTTVAVVERRDLDDQRELEFGLPAEFERLLVEKGSVALDGVSLTVASVDPIGARFGVALIPHTLEVTTLGGLGVGDLVHLEIDILAKYVDRILTQRFGEAGVG